MSTPFRTKLRMEECSQEYWEFVRLLRMNAAVKDGFVEDAKISAEDQIQYMKNHALAYRVCLYDQVPCGYIGVVENDLRICVSPEFWGKGVGSFMIEQTKDIWPNPQVKIKFSNIASINLFKKNGFTEKFVILEKNDGSNA